MLQKIGKDQKGQGIMELLVAVFVIVTGIVAVLALSISTITTARASINSGESTKLSREGLEVARNIRDSNWLKIDQGELDFSLWNDGLHEGNDYDAVAQFNPENHQWELAYNNSNYRLRRRSDGLYIYYDYDSDLPESMFSRTIYTFPICYNETSEEETVMGQGESCTADPQIGIKVKSVVTWSEKGNDKSVTAEENLYNWRP